MEILTAEEINLIVNRVVNTAIEKYQAMRKDDMKEFLERMDCWMDRIDCQKIR